MRSTVEVELCFGKVRCSGALARCSRCGQGRATFTRKLDGSRFLHRDCRTDSSPAAPSAKLDRSNKIGGLRTDKYTHFAVPSAGLGISKTSLETGLLLYGVPVGRKL